MAPPLPKEPYEVPCPICEQCRFTATWRHTVMEFGYTLTLVRKPEEGTRNIDPAVSMVISDFDLEGDAKRFTMVVNHAYRTMALKLCPRAPAVGMAACPNCGVNMFSVQDVGRTIPWDPADPRGIDRWEQAYKMDIDGTNSDRRREHVYVLSCEQCGWQSSRLVAQFKKDDGAFHISKARKT